MKRILLFAGCLLAFTLSAQTPSYLLTEKYHAYRGGDQTTKQQVEFKDPVSLGKSLVWDFRMLRPVNDEYTLDYIFPDSTNMNRICGIGHNTNIKVNNRGGRSNANKAYEQRAVGFENRVRKSMGLPLITTYGGKMIKNNPCAK
jgi:hypothetical protein